MPEHTIHLIGNAHLDPVWLWQWPEGMQEAQATFRSALDRMREFPEFVFTSSSAAIYAWIAATDPAMLDEIRTRVAEGRWRIAGGWWIQPDCNIPCGESFVRQGLYGQRYFKEHLGVTATVGYNVDSFGHNGMLPQILRKQGMDAYVFMRPQEFEKGLPGRLFWWEADDGSRVLAFRIAYGYQTNDGNLDAQIRRCAAELAPPLTETMCFYGVGNHGGGPTIANLHRIRELSQEPDAPALVHSSPAAYFCDVRKRGLPLPVVHGELQRHASGCYAAHSGIKRWNRQAENRLLAAEKWAAVAQRELGLPYPAAELTHAWQTVLFNQFHDILAGTSVAPAYEDARDGYGEALAIAGRALHHATQALAWAIDLPFEEGMTPIVVFNPHPWPVRAGAEVEFGKLGSDDVLLDDAGRRVPLQTIRSRATVRAGRNRLCFVADLPPLGYRVYRVASRPDAGPLPEPSLSAGETWLENGRFRLEIDPATGYLISLRDTARDVELIRGEAAKPVVIADPSDTWSHGVLRFDDVVGAFVARRVRLIERGPVRAVLRVESAYGDSTLTQDFVVYADLDPIEVRVAVDWRERHRLLKLTFPLTIHHAATTYEIPYGHVERAGSGEEEPGQRWLDLTGILNGVLEPYGLSLLNDGKYSFHSRERELGMTVLRSPIFAHHDPYVPDPAGDYEYMDQGIQHFTYALLPHVGPWQQAATVRRAAELNQPPLPLVASCHPGRLPQTASYVSVDRPNVDVTVLKRAEDNDDLIARCVETVGEATHATLDFSAWGRTLDACFSPCEIKTLRIPADGALPVTETDLLEWAAG